MLLVEILFGLNKNELMLVIERESHEESIRDCLKLYHDIAKVHRAQELFWICKTVREVSWFGPPPLYEQDLHMDEVLQRVQHCSTNLTSGGTFHGRQSLFP